MAVVGHAEWIDFVRVARVPHAGEIVQAAEWWAEAAGGGGVSSVRLARLAGACTFFTALGEGELGSRVRAQLEGHGVRVEATLRAEPHRRGFTFVDANGERTITIVGEKQMPHGEDPLPWGLLDETDAVYFVSGNAAAVREARRARVLVATSRVLPTLAEAGVHLDALVGSELDPSERYAPGDLDPSPALVVATRGDSGGIWTTADGRSGTYAEAPIPGVVEDSYGSGDTFAAGLTHALGSGLPVEEALAFAARAAAEQLTRRGAHGR